MPGKGKYRRHWTSYAVLLVALAALSGSIHQLSLAWQKGRLARAMEEAGGYVVPSSRHPLDQIGSFHFYPIIEVCIESGSHPIPEEIKSISKFPEIMILNLKTTSMGDNQLILFEDFDKILIINLNGSEVTPQGIAKLIKKQPHLKGRLRFDEP
jgi:hypothetical protein